MPVSSKCTRALTFQNVWQTMTSAEQMHLLREQQRREQQAMAMQQLRSIVSSFHVTSPRQPLNEGEGGGGSRTQGARVRGRSMSPRPVREGDRLDAPADALNPFAVADDYNPFRSLSRPSPGAPVGNSGGLYICVLYICVLYMCVRVCVYTHI